ncbi:bifunctional nuclease family protein [Pseudodesulfovibrio cashew]|uniref:Bifunctional nuclease family protein n=1 Tax=Pseudodesulfovibrio cashew TaxID=2678688 RepID=A0A6I6JFW1_9BACT|nr:bifunctional nuclease family protein [Pseudodesulfovibrio cashew]QGY41061.1 bifunctional nuclease family protein [Pseudodesulfovibrio cashew]
MVEMEIFGLALDENSKSPILILKEEGGRALPIWIGAMEAMAISMALNKVPFPRPMTHDLLLSAIRKMDGSVVRVEVTDLESGTFYAEIVIASGEDTIRLDSRPSDAIALAVRAKCPILVGDGVLEEAGAPMQEEGGEAVIKTEDADKWADELEKFSEEETKYKM